MAWSVHLLKTKMWANTTYFSSLTYFFMSSGVFPMASAFCFSASTVFFILPVFCSDTLR